MIVFSLWGFVEEGWIGQTLAIGNVRLQIERPCPRGIMTTLSQDELSKDPNVLRTAVQQNAGNVGVYATVTSAGQVRRGHKIMLSGPDH